MKKVEAIIIGAGRSGTTTLYKYLEDHPDVCFSEIKEIHYFTVEDLYNRGNDYYHSFYKSKEGQILTGADTYLLIDKKAPERIKAYNPNMKIIIMLREPVSRAYSGYQYAVNNGYLKESVTFRQSIENEDFHRNNSDIITQNNVCNLYQSKYFEHISYWMRFFPKDNFLILQTDDLNKNRSELLLQLSRFLNIPNFKNSEEAILANKAAKSKSKVLQQFLLNRKNPMRIMLRKILPKKVKSKILHSGISEKLMKLNRKEIDYVPINTADKEFCHTILKEDTSNLKEEFGIDFTM